MKWFERLADRIHEKGDAEARAQGLDVVRLPWGRRQISDPRLTYLFDARRQAFAARQRELREAAAAHGLDISELHLIGVDRTRRRSTNDQPSDYLNA